MINEQCMAMVLEQIMAEWDVMLYWKDVNGVYLGANQRCVDETKKLTGVYGLVGKTDVDIFDKKTAQLFISHDQAVMNNLKEYHFKELIFDKDGFKIIQLSQKKPLIDKHGCAVGILGITKRINQISIDDNQHVLLTPRESEVLCHICKGSSAKTIAKQLGVSQRTVDAHMDNIKAKFSCSKKEALLHLLSKQGYLSYLNKFFL